MNGRLHLPVAIGRPTAWNVPPEAGFTFDGLTETSAKVRSSKGKKRLYSTLGGARSKPFSGVPGVSVLVWFATLRFKKEANVMDRIAKQINDIQRTTFDNVFFAASAIQDQTEKAINAFLETGVWPMPEEGKKVLNEFVQAFKKGREEFKRIMDDSFDKIESSFSEEESGSQQSRGEPREGRTPEREARGEQESRSQESRAGEESRGGQESRARGSRSRRSR
jgi:hypothetical protein